MKLHEAVRTEVQLQEKLVPGLLYGFDISVQNPATAATASETRLRDVRTVRRNLRQFQVPQSPGRWSSCKVVKEELFQVPLRQFSSKCPSCGSLLGAR